MSENCLLDSENGFLDSENSFLDSENSFLDLDNWFVEFGILKYKVLDHLQSINPSTIHPRALEYREGCTADEKNANGCRGAMVGRTIVAFLH